MKEDDEFNELFQLQEMHLNSIIQKQLRQRNLTQPELSKIYIQFCKQSNSDEDFQTKIFQNYPNIMVSKHFLTSLYHTIKQQLPRMVNMQQENDQKIQQKIQHSKQQSQENYLQKNVRDNIKNTSFPGLAIQNTDQIDLDLGFDDVQAPPPVRSDIKVSRSRSPSSSRERSRKKQKKQKKQKKEKKQKKHRQYSRSPSYSRQEKGKPWKRDKQWDQSRKKPKQVRQQPRSVRPKQVLQNQIYKAVVRRVDKVGCVVSIDAQVSKLASVHLNQMRDNFQGEPGDIVKQGQQVWVKVIAINDGKVRASMKTISQSNGKDLSQPQHSSHTTQSKPKQSSHHIKSIGQLTGIKISKQDQVNQQQGAGYGQLWQISRLGYMGKANRGTFKEDIQEVNIEVNDREPPFLTGQTTKAGVNLSPVRIVKNPEGTLQREAENAVQYAKQRRQIRQKSKNDARGQLNKVLQEVIPDGSYSKQITKRARLSIKQQRQSLPIFNYRDQLIQACLDNRILIVIGQTGSGKTTQITQYLHEAGFSKRGKIGCTQPRRVAAMSVAKRVCQQMDVVLGQEVGYTIRFEDYTSKNTIIKYMTDGMLLRQALLDKYLSQYSVIMLDEAHERTIHTDVLFGILKKVAQKRKDFTLIVTSATLEAKKFSSYFSDCKIFSIPGRTFNVEILYAKQPQTDYLDAALMCVLQIHIDEPPGDILLFLTGQEEIDTACQVLNQRMKKLGSEAPELIVLPVYSALPSELQSKIFDPAPRGKRKCVIATNIAQASLTIDGIYYVVDPGFCKIKTFNSKLGMDTLVVAPISQASAKQRAGRAGRTGPGKCYRLYTQQAYQAEMLPTSIPEIQRANLSNTVLQLKAMGINDLINFDFMDAPPIQTLIAALEQLYYLSALDDEGLLTKVGRKMAEFPLQPPLSKMLLTSIDFGCTQEIATIISLLSVQNIFYRPKEKQMIADQKKTKFHSSQGDHLTYLSIYESWKKSGFTQGWCHQNYIQQRSLKRAQDVKKQIIDLLQRYKFKIESCNGNTTLIRKTIVSGFFFHAAKKDSKGGYRTLVDDHQVYIHPSSSLFNKEPEWVIYHELIFTSKEYMRDVCAINPKWLIDVAPNFFKFTDQLGFSRKKRNQKLDPLNQKYGDPNAWRLSKRKG